MERKEIPREGFHRPKVDGLTIETPLSLDLREVSIRSDILYKKTQTKPHWLDRVLQKMRCSVETGGMMEFSVLCG